MTQADLIAALPPPRLPAAMGQLTLPEMLALAGLGLLIALVLGAVLRPLLIRRVTLRARLRATRGLPPQERLLALARILGHLPTPLRAAAYGAVPPPPEAEIERIAQAARRRP